MMTAITTTVYFPNISFMNEGVSNSLYSCYYGLSALTMTVTTFNAHHVISVTDWPGFLGSRGQLCVKPDLGTRWGFRAGPGVLQGGEASQPSVTMGSSSQAGRWLGLRSAVQPVWGRLLNLQADCRSIELRLSEGAVVTMPPASLLFKYRNMFSCDFESASATLEAGATPRHLLLERSPNDACSENAISGHSFLN